MRTHIDEFDLEIIDSVITDLDYLVERFQWEKSLEYAAKFEECIEYLRELRKEIEK